MPSNIEENKLQSMCQFSHCANNLRHIIKENLSLQPIFKPIPSVNQVFIRNSESDFKPHFSCLSESYKPVLLYAPLEQEEKERFIVITDMKN